MMINLLPLQQQPYQYRINLIKRRLCYSLGITLFLLIITYSAFTIYTLFLQREATKLASQNTQETQLFQQIVTLKKNIQHYAENTQHQNDAQQKKQQLIDFLTQLPQDLPKGLRLVNMSWYEQAGVIYGMASHHREVMDFLEILKNNIHFTSVNLVKSGNRHEEDHLPPIYFVIDFS